MKPCIALAFSVFAALGTALAQPDPATVAAAIAEREAAEERYRTLNAKIESLTASNDFLRKRLATLSDEVQRLRDAQARPVDNSAIQEDLRRLADAIKEVDRKREADKKLFLDALDQLKELIKTAASNRAPTPTPGTTPPGSTTTFQYIVKPGDTLSSIIAAYNAEFKRQGKGAITQQQVVEANPPGFKPELIRPDQKIIIPDPGP